MLSESPVYRPSLGTKDQLSFGKGIISPEEKKSTSTFPSFFKRQQVQYSDEAFDSNEGRSSKGKSLQPKQGAILRKSRLVPVDSSSRQGSKLRQRNTLYVGNEWDRNLGNDEWRILFYISRWLAFGIDKLRGIKSGMQPETQVLRKFASPYTILQLIIVCSLFYLMFKIFV